MAVYQTNIQLIPREWAKQAGFSPDALYDEDGFDTAPAWSGRSLPHDIDAMLARILPPAKSWDHDLSCWGSDKGSDIHVWRENGQIQSVGFRIDLRQEPSRLVSEISSLAVALACVLFVPGQRTIIEPGADTLKQLLLRSDAAMFIRDPAGFLRSLP